MFLKTQVSIFRDNEASMTIKAILFDMDGVLIDAKEWHYEALNKALLMDCLPKKN